MAKRKLRQDPRNFESRLHFERKISKKTINSGLNIRDPAKSTAPHQMKDIAFQPRGTIHNNHPK